MSELVAALEDSVDENTLLSQERGTDDGEQQLSEESASGSSEENQPENDEEAVVEKRLRDTQAKVTELAEQLKAAQSQLQVIQQPREEPFDEEKFIDDFIGGEAAYEKFRDDPAQLAKDLAKKMLYHQAQVLVERDKHWTSELESLKQSFKAQDPEYAQYADTIKEVEGKFDLSKMQVEDKIELAKMIRAGQKKSVKAPPPGPSARKGSQVTSATSAPPGYFEMLGLVGEQKANNTLL